MASKNKTRLRMEQLKGGTLSLADGADSYKIESGVSGSEIDYLAVNSTSGSEKITLGESSASIELAGPILTGGSFKDEDNMASDSNTAVASQQSIKAYVDTAVSNAGTSFFVEDEGENEVEITNGKEIQFSGSNGLSTAVTGAGSDADPYVLDITVDATQTSISTISHASLVLGAGGSNSGIDFSGASGTEIAFAAGSGDDQLVLEDGVLRPNLDDDVDLGTSTKKFKDAYFDGTVNADAVTMGGNIVMSSNKITGLASPTVDGDAANKGYVDAAIEGLDVKQSVVAASTAAVTLASELEAGDAIDGVTLVAGDRVLLKDQAADEENGIWLVAASGAPSRPEDFDSSADVSSGLFVFVEDGTANQHAGFILTTDGAITVDTTELQFTQFSGAGAITAGLGLSKSGNTLNLELSELADTATLNLTADFIPFVDADDNSTKKELVSDLMTAMVAATNGGMALSPQKQLIVDVNDLDTVTAIASGDTFAMAQEAESGDPTKKITIDNIASQLAKNAGALSALSGEMSVEVDDATIEIASNALQVKEAGLIFAHMTNINAYLSVGASPGNNVLSSGIEFLSASENNPGGISGLDELVQSVSGANVKAMNEGSDVQVYLNGQLLMRDFTDADGSATFSSGASTVGAIADYKFISSGAPAAVSIQFQPDTLEEGDILMIKGIVG